jgi:hypothetical protein
MKNLSLFGVFATVMLVMTVNDPMISAVPVLTAAKLQDKIVEAAPPAAPTFAQMLQEQRKKLKSDPNADRARAQREQQAMIDEVNSMIGTKKEDIDKQVAADITVVKTTYNTKILDLESSRVKAKQDACTASSDVIDGQINDQIATLKTEMASQVTTLQTAGEKKKTDMESHMDSVGGGDLTRVTVTSTPKIVGDVQSHGVKGKGNNLV